nr:MAG TPA: hypothetical protein [Caudoviricetes sp.]
MSHYVAKVLHKRPNEILDTWCPAELLVAYGFYTNEESYQNFLQWKGLSQKEKSKIGKPDEYHVRFYAPEDLEEEEGMTADGD